MAHLNPAPIRQNRAPLSILGAVGFLVTAGACALIVLYPQQGSLGGALLLGAVALGGLGFLVAQARGGATGALAQDPKLPALIQLAEGTRTAMAMTSQNGAVLYANDAYRRQFGQAQPSLALARAERESAALYRLIRMALSEGAAEDEVNVAAEGEVLRAARIALERIESREGPLLAWRIHAHGPHLIEGEAGLARPAPAPAGEAPPVPGALSTARIVADAPVGIVLLDGEGRIVEANAMFNSIAKLEACAARSFVSLLSPGDVAEFDNRLRQGGGAHTPLELRFSGPPERTVQVYVRALEGGAGAVLYVFDTTEQKNLELQFAQSQKMQAVGQLAGGIAHDFNNTLQAMIGFCELLLMRHPPGDPSFADIDQIRQNATRGAGLVRQLLAFSRQQTLLPRVLWLPDAVAELRPLLLRLIGDKVKLDIKHERDVGRVKVDETQLGQVLMNLAANARDAMSEGGTLTIRTANVSKAESAALGHELMPPAEYVLLEVADTGTGIPKELLGKIFEPFFTTKDVGQGTGLGLSSVYGIVKQTNGFIFPESQLGKGTAFRIYLPRHAQDESAAQASPESAAPQRSQDHTGRGTVLIVEDEDAVRAFAMRALASRGYSVLEASNGEIALDLIRAHDGPIDLLISDVIMPAMDGPTLVKAVKNERPEMKIVLISGYAEDAFRQELGRDSQLAFLPKPFSLKQLVSKVKEVMDG